MKPDDRPTAGGKAQGPANAFSSQAPTVHLPKGGGAIRGIGETFAANPVTGTGSMSVPIATSPGRSGFGPELALSYDSGAGNGPFGFGWSLAVNAITRKTGKCLPRYLDAQESDVFVLAGAEDLVPVLAADARGAWQREVVPPRTIGGKTYRIDRYRPRIEGLFARIERWSDCADKTDVFWRSISRDNVTTWYGKSANSRIADPADPGRIFTWLACLSHDDKGNAITYGYKAEDSANIFEDTEGRRLSLVHERNRSDQSRSAQRYLKRIRYGNRTPYFPELKPDHPWPEPLDPPWPGPPASDVPDGSHAWMFEVVLDYGEHGAAAPLPGDSGPWCARPDPFSTYRAAFEVRTYRTCRRALMFHHFPGEDGVGRNCLVRSTDFFYGDAADPAAARNPVYVFLKSVTQTGYRRSNGGYDRSSLPPVQFEYAQPVVQDTVEEVEEASLENLPVGLDGSAYRWVDLHGEGIPGILTEQAAAWYYKRNWSPIPARLEDGSAVLKAKFAPLETVLLKPNTTLAGGAEFMDLAGDGLPDVVVMDGPAPGCYEHDEANGWKAYRPYTSRINGDPRNANARLIDLDGDGRADLLITDDDALVWHASLAEDGYGPAQRVIQSLDEEKGPRVIFNDGTQAIYLADLSGDGLTDIVRLCNGNICYWPNLGYGRFGPKVAMDNAPCFDQPGQFDHRRIRLADIDGSGTTDIIYLHRDGVRLYFNQSGNSWSAAHELKVFPRIDDLVRIQPVDLLGNGTACLVWSSPMPGDAAAPMRYLNLMGGSKPHLLTRAVNNLGAETHITYAPSTRFYLQDKREGKPWIRPLPFPVHVVERVETYDRISRNRYTTRYAYRHGCFDGEDREFRGFGMVEQWDTGEFAVLAGGGHLAANMAGASHVPAIHTRTWFHTGICVGRGHVSDYFAGLLDSRDQGEYFREPGLTDEEAGRMLLADTVLPAGLTEAELREACRALKGMMLRQEVYADDAGPGAAPEQAARAATPYTVTEQNFTLRLLQPQGANRHAIFFPHAAETIGYHYERNPADPRIQHTLTLETDAWGNVLKQAAAAYGRRTEIRMIGQQGEVYKIPNPGLAGLDASDQARQTTPLLTLTETRVTNAIALADTHRGPLPCEVRTVELTGYAATGPDGRLIAKDLVEDDPAYPGRLRLRGEGEEIAYEATASGKRRRRVIEWLRTLYRHDELTGLLPFGQLHPRALAGERYKLAFTPGLLAQVFQRPCPGQARQALLPDPAGVLGGQSGMQGGYLPGQALKADGRFPASDADGYWWIPSGQSYFTTNPAHGAAAELGQARQHFFLPRRYRDPFGHDTLVDFDASDLLVAETRDALGNRTSVEVHDYRVLQPRLISDPNRNQNETVFDVLGMVVGTAVMGKPDAAGRPGDTLAGFVTDLPVAQRDAFIAAPVQPAADSLRSEAAAITHQLLQGATTRIVYDLDRYQRLGEPPIAATIVRETHVSDLALGQQSRLQVSFSYSDGFGREIQKKIPAEPGPLDLHNPASAPVNPRWVGSGWTIFNNKGKPVRQYEPFFDDTPGFKFAAIHGVSPVLFYDPAERVIATLHPNHTYEKVVFDPWQQTTWDVNDTCAPRAATPGSQQLAATGDPRTDPDMAGYVAGYFKAMAADPLQPQPWQTWHARRIGNALGLDERHAAERAAGHAATPATVHVDALGRPFLTVTRNRVLCNGHPLDGKPDEQIRTRVKLDIEGNQLEVQDERRLPGAPGLMEQRSVVQYAYDMLGNRIYQISMEAGARWMLNDVAGKPIRSWDSRGHDFTTNYDALRRPVEQYVLGRYSDPDPLQPNSDPRTLNPPDPAGLLVDRIDYGEPPPGATPSQEAQAQRLNLRTRIARHADAAGVTTNARLDAGGNPVEAYDYKGNLLCSTRQLVDDYKGIPDWSRNPPPKLDAETFGGRTRYDALNRPIQSITSRGNPGRGGCHVIQPVFNEAGLLEQVHVWLERATEPAVLLDPAHEAPSPAGVANIDYDAKGQRTLIDYPARDATVIRTTYAYDRETFRLTHLYTRRGVNPATAQGVAFTGDCDNPYPPPPATVAAPRTPPPGKGCGLQNLHYTYDPAGNITHIRDDAQQTLYFQNRRVEPDNDYVYDACYRLIQAKGREHLGQGGVSISHSYNDAGRAGIVSANPPGHFAPNQHSAMGRYTESYVYDAAGNFLHMQHARDNAAVADWTRLYHYGEASLIEPARQSNRLTGTTVGNAPPESYSHDAHGNMLGMPQLQAMQWDYRDRLLMTQRQKVNLDDVEGAERHGERTWYVYDAAGQRVRKVTELANSGGIKDERIYVGGFEVFRSYKGPAQARVVKLERETLHVMDDKQRIALAEMRTLGNEVDVAQRLIRYQFGNHLGSSSLELDEQAQIISYEEYAPYGSTTYQAVRSGTEAAKRYRYTGKERDEESGSCYHGARYYFPWLGRWSRCDPAGLGDGTNLYQFVRCHPINLSDPTGTACDPSVASCAELMKNWSYSEPIPNREDFHNAQQDHPIQVQLRKEERKGFYNRNVSKRRNEQTVVVETGRGYFHTEVGKLQAEITARVRAGVITTQAGLIEATRNAYEVAARRTNVQVDQQALDRAIVSNLATLSESPAQTHSELVAQGATATDFDAYVASADSIADPLPPPPLDPKEEKAQASGVSTSSSAHVNQSVLPSSPQSETYEASAAANLIVLAAGIYFGGFIARGLVRVAAVEGEAAHIRVANEVVEAAEQEVRVRIEIEAEEEVEREVVEHQLNRLRLPLP